MVVSAILTTALSPITGALFGASYGTSIRIGYEIIFPALFGDLMNDKKNNPSKGQQDGAKQTIQAMHKMFQGVGGAAAMEFGIEQGIEMAKKKTESPDVQDMIDLSLGITDRQIQKRGKARQFQDPIKDEEDSSTKVKDFNKGGDFLKMSESEIIEFFDAFTLRTEFDIAFKLLIKHFNNNKNHPTVIRVLKLRPGKGKTAKQVIPKVTKPKSFVQQVALMFNALLQPLLKATNKAGNKAIRAKNLKLFLKLAKAYNQFVAKNGKPKLQIDTQKSLQQRRLVPK